MHPQALASLLAATIPSKHPVLITGAPGVGKSDIVSQVCASVAADLIIEHPVVSDPTDYKGLPFADNGVAHFLPFANLLALINADRLLVCFIDDLGQAPPSVQAACMQLILARRINGHHVSPHVCFVAATNRHTDMAGVTGILEPVKSRFVTIVELAPRLDDWITWALHHDIPAELVAFIRFRPDLLFDFKPSHEIKNSPCPRTVANVGELMKLKLPESMEYEAYSGAAGEGFAVELCGFLRMCRDSLPNPDAILLNPSKADVPKDAATLYALCGALVSKVNSKNFNRIATYADRIPVEFATLLVKDCIDVCPEIANTTAVVKWAVSHTDVLV